MKKVVGSVVVIAVIIAAFNWQRIGYELIVAPWFSTKTVKLRGAFFRTRAKFIVDGDEEIEFDTIVACNATVSGNRATGTSTLHGMVPNVVGLRTKAGHAVVVSTPMLCSYAGRDSWDKIRTKFLPLTAWFEDADNPSSGYFYASADAYENPASRLTFVSASVGPATRTEWEEWRATKDQRPANVIDPNSISPAVGASDKNWRNFWPGRLYFGGDCNGYIRLEIVERYRHRIRKFWPEHRPKYWIPKGNDRAKEFRAIIRGQTWKEGDRVAQHDDDPIKYIGAVPGEKSLGKFWLGTNWENKFSAADRGGQYGKTIYTRNRAYPGEYYPTMNFNSPPLVTPETGREAVRRSSVVTNGGKNRGYLFCQGGFGGSPVGRQYYYGLDEHRTLQLDVDGVSVFYHKPILNYWVDYFVENDSHLWARISTHLTSNGGIE